MMIMVVKARNVYSSLVASISPPIDVQLPPNCIKRFSHDNPCPRLADSGQETPKLGGKRPYCPSFDCSRLVIVS